jgi:hypothetical protein
MKTSDVMNVVLMHKQAFTYLSLASNVFSSMYVTYAADAITAVIMLKQGIYIEPKELLAKLK